MLLTGLNLVEVVKKITTEARELPDPFRTKTFDDFADGLTPEELVIIDSLVRIPPEIEEVIESHGANDHISRAARIIGHDLRSAYNVIAIEVQLHKALSNTGRYPETNKRKLALYLANLRYTYQAMGYLATKGEHFVEPIPTEHLSDLVKSRGLPFTQVEALSFGVIDPGVLLPPEYLAVCQYITNARGRFAVSVKLGDTEKTIQVRDYGHGLLNEDGTPMRPEKLSTIFSEYSTKKNGGLGLQLVRDVHALLGGSYEVYSTTEAGTGVHFSSSSGVSEVPPAKLTGCTFISHFPNKH